MKGYGSKLKELRGNRTLQKVADDIGISHSALAMYESESRVPRDEIKVALANYYKKSVAYIFYPKMSQIVREESGEKNAEAVPND